MKECIKRACFTIDTNEIQYFLYIFFPNHFRIYINAQDHHFEHLQYLRI